MSNTTTIITSKLTNAQKIESYVKSLPAIPDSNFTPDVIIKWDKTKSCTNEWGEKKVQKTPVWYFPKTGELKVMKTLPWGYKNSYLFDDIKDATTLWYSNEKTSVITPNKFIFSYYGKYHKEIDAFEIAQIEMVGGRGKEGESRIWEYTDINHKRYFLFSNGEAVKGFSYLEKDGKFYNKSLKHWLQSEIAQNIHNRYFDKQALIFLRTKFKEEYSNRETYWLPCRVSQWYGKIAPRPVKVGSAKENLLQSLNLPEYNSDYLQNLLKNNEFGAICVSYQDGVLVRHYRKSGLNHKYTEDYRFFFSEKEEFILKSSLNRWVNCSNNNCYACCSPDLIINVEVLKTIKRIDRIFNVWMSEDFIKSHLFQNLTTLLKHPIVEKVYKAGYIGLAEKLISAPTTTLKDFFDTTSKKTGSIYSNLGMNKVQLNILEETLRNNNPLPRMKFLKILGGEDVIHWDETKSRKYFKFASLANNSFTGLIFWVNDFNIPTYLGGYNTRNHTITEEELKKVQKVVNLQAKNPNIDIVQLFKDTVFSMCSSVREILPNMNPYNARTFRDLNWMHEQYIEIGNTKKWEKTINPEKWEKLNQKRIELYEKIGDDFKIIVPRKPAEIVNEGAMLNHCVGGYVDSVASGYKTILFLRKTSAPEQPFYTIEVTEGRVVQIHGNHNRWLGNNPEAIQFVIDWLKETKITCSSNILFNLGQGYAGSNNRLDSYNYQLNKFVIE